MNYNKLLIAASAVALGIVSTHGHAETVHTKTIVKTQDIENTNQVMFSDFDLNNDNVYSKAEVGEKLFYIFDIDGNEVIDNLEWDHENVFTIIPVEEQTFTYVDYNDDGLTDASTYTYTTFYTESGLARFDNDMDGLSASDFIGVGFQSLDDNDNNVIELEEWKEVYTEAFISSNAEQERYND